MKQSEVLRNVFILLLLLAIGVASRFFLIDVPNFKPIAAIVLFAAFWFRSYWVAGLSLVLVMCVSNSALDHCPWQVTLGVVGVQSKQFLNWSDLHLRCRLLSS